MAESIRVDVVQALPQRCARVTLDLAPGATVRDALREAAGQGLAAAASVEEGRVGIHGHVVALERTLESGDRIELYRPLLCDPKQTRRQRAAGRARR